MTIVYYSLAITYFCLGKFYYKEKTGKILSYATAGIWLLNGIMTDVFDINGIINW